MEFYNKKRLMENIIWLSTENPYFGLQSDIIHKSDKWLQVYWSSLALNLLFKAPSSVHKHTYMQEARIIIEKQFKCTTRFVKDIKHHCTYRYFHSRKKKGMNVNASLGVSITQPFWLQLFYNRFQATWSIGKKVNRLCYLISLP